MAVARPAPVCRGLIGLDIETSKTTGEVPPPFALTVERLRMKQLAAVAWTTFNHTEELPRYRIVLPLSEPIEFANLPADQVARIDHFLVPLVATQLRLQGVIDPGKLGAESLLYTARHPNGKPHWSAIVPGAAIPAAMLTAVAQTMLIGWQMSEAQRAALRQTLELPAEVQALIDGYNEANPLKEVFARYGWRTANGSRWRSPYQTPTNEAATRVIDKGPFAGRRFFSWSESDVAAGIGRPCSRGGCWGSAFDLFRHFEHAGDFGAALDALRQSSGATP